ncbi:MAG: FtsX-like permease family protein, partial [Acidobacteriota bacterium]
KIGWGVRVVGGFTILAGIVILAGVVGAGSVRRAREVALLKTLGMTRHGVIAVFSVEYALIGLVAGTIGACGSGLVSWIVLTQAMDTPWSFHPAPYLAAVAGCVGLAVVAGIATSAGPLSRRPIEVLRTL